MSVGRDREEDRQLAAEYALGLLDSAEARVFEARLAAEPDLREDYALWAESFAALTDSIPDQTPPRDALAKIEAVLFAPEPKPRWSLSRWLGLGVTAAAGLMMLVLWLGPMGPAPRPDMVALLAADSGDLKVSAGYVSDEKTLYLDRSVGRPASGRSFELWLIEGDNPPVSLGVLPDVDRALIVVPEALSARMAGGTLAISDEPEGGSPTGAPTGAVLAVAPLITSS
ncbi:anti-sigma factor [Rhodobacteraceae bacterium D3-12]|nr:anti-sigma factor [Rhodobacteraceae bacterium D3-12]